MLAAVLIAASSFTFAGEPSDTININEVVVSGTRIEVGRNSLPQSITVVSNDEIESQEESNILPVVAKVTPSVFVSEIGVAGYALGNSTSGQITIRGVGGSPNARVMMLVDGQPQYMGVFGHPLPNFHMASNVERVEVVRGPASLLYGSNAMGGVINVITKKHDSKGLNIRGHAAYGSFNTLKTGVSAGYTGDRFSAGVSFNHNQTDGHRDSTEFNITNLHAYAAYELNDNWTTRVGYTWAGYSFMDPGSVLNTDQNTFLGDITRQMATFSMRNTYANTMGGIYAFINTGHHSFSDGWVSDDVNKGVNIYQAYKPWAGASLTGGFDMKNYGGEGSFGFFADTFLTVSETAGYLLAEQEIGTVLSISAGARYEHHSNFGGELVPQFGVTVSPISGSTVKALISKGFRSPTIMEMYLFAPNADLGPERLWNYEASFSQRFGSVGILNITGYVLDGSNLIITEPNPNPGPPLRSNGGAFTNWGVEVESSIQPHDDLRLDISYSYLNTDKPRYYAPAHQFYAGAMYNMGNFNFALNLKQVVGLYTFIDVTDATNDVLQAYTLLDFKVRYQVIDNLGVFVAGKNLLNQQYETVYGYPMPGINFMAGLTVNFNE